MTLEATAETLATLMGRTFTEAEAAQADLALTLALVAVQAESGQTFTKVTGDTVKLDGTWNRDLELPERPALAVHSVSVNGTALDASSWTWNGRQIIRRGAPFIIGVDDWRDDTGYFSNLVEGSVGPTPMHWAGPDAVITVDYDHGLETLPDVFTLVQLSVAKRAMVNPDSVVSEMLGAYQVQYGSTAAGFELTDGECRLLKKFKRRAHA